MSSQTAFPSGGPVTQVHTERIGGDGEEVQGFDRGIQIQQVPLTLASLTTVSQPAPSYDYDFEPTNHLSIADQFDDGIPPNHERSETIGSDTIVDDIISLEPPTAVKASGSGGNVGVGVGSAGIPTNINKQSQQHSQHPHINNNNSDSDIISDGVPLDLDRDSNLGRKDELSHAPSGAHSKKRGGTGSRRYYEERRSKYPMVDDDQESVEEEDSRKRHHHRDRGGERGEDHYWPRERMHSESFRERRLDRPSGESGSRYRHNESRGRHHDDWDNQSRSSKYYRDEFDDSMPRPISRNSRPDRYYDREREDPYLYNRGYRPRYDDFELRRQEELYERERARAFRPVPDSRFGPDPFLTYGGAQPLVSIPTRGHIGGGMGAGGTMNHNAMEFRGYLEELRIKNPAVYRDWYNKYLAHMRNRDRIPFPTLPGYVGSGALMSSNVEGSSSFQHESVPESLEQQRHSISSGGRQSVHDFQSLQPCSISSEVSQIFGSQDVFPSMAGITPVVAARRTPPKFRNTHGFAVFTPQGGLMKIKGSAGTTIELCGVKQLYQHLPEVKELEAFPGPLIKGVTHKNTVINFCQRKIKEISTSGRVTGDSENCILLWEVLMLLLRQNGNVVGSDISELLLDPKRSSPAIQQGHHGGAVGVKLPKQNSEDGNGTDSGEVSQPESVEKEQEFGSTGSNIEKKSLEEITEQFCSLLLFGHRKDALEYAMSNGLWGHALFLSSKLDERTHAHVLTKFGTVLPVNHPIQTLYQMISGRQPTSVTNCIDDSFGDWKPHLAMILSNSGLRSEVEIKAIVSLGDTLGYKNQLFASQFCYLMAQMEFSTHSKLGPLLGYTAHHDNVIEATQMTEIYEFAKSLAEPNFRLGSSFVDKKLSYMNTLIDYGFLLEAYSYCEEISKQLLLSNCDNTEQFVLDHLIQVGERLKHFCEDPSPTESFNVHWITSMKEKVQEISRDTTNTTAETSSFSGTENVDGHFQSELPTSSLNLNAPEREMNNGDNGTLQSDNFNYPLQPQQPLIENLTPEWPTPFSNGHGGVTNTPNIAHDPYHQNPIEPSLMSDRWDNRRNSNDIQQYQQPLSNNPYDISSSAMYTSSSQPLQQPSFPEPAGNQPQYDMNYDRDNSGGGSQSNMFQPQPSYANPPNPMMGGQPRISSSNSDLHGNDKKKTVRFEEGQVKLANGSNLCFSGKNGVELSKDRILETKSAEMKSVLKLKHSNNISSPSNNKHKTVHSGSGGGVGGMAKSNSEGCLAPSLLQYDEQWDKEKGFSNPSPNVKFNGTYPIDEPSSLRAKLPPLVNVNNFSNRISKTFPIDKKCCDVQEPCLEHNIYQSGNSLASTPPSSNSINTFDAYNKMDKRANNLTGANLGKRDENKDGSKKSGKGDGGGGNQSGGIFSSIFSKLTLKPKNQMILPDDKDKSIVWDDVKKVWVNKNEDENESSAPAGPPPKDSDLMTPSPLQGAAPPMHQPNPISNSNSAVTNQFMGNPNVPIFNSHQSANSFGGAVPAAMPMNAVGGGGSPFEFNANINNNINNSVNKYKLPKGSRTNQYVDVFNPGGGNPAKPISKMGGSMANGIMPMPNIFIPPPSESTGPVNFLTSHTENPLISDQDNVANERNYATM